MKITRKTTISVIAVRRFTERQSAETENIRCERCAEPMTAAQTAADLFGVGSRVIFRLIEAGAIHFVETARNEIYVCPLSVRKILNRANEPDETRKIQQTNKIESNNNENNFENDERISNETTG